ncbi:MAG: class I tRNA ligase family protein, partial [Clostridia bacterium]|nr:class I tRNA ligase family protein [Clostridia bacterium]MDD4798993.1 class I tRNA ligase family protein [Clostridia bacterium]
QSILAEVLTRITELLHPFIPFITEELWQHLPHNGKSIMLTEYPTGEGMNCYEQEAEQMRLIMDVIRSLRNLRAEMSVPPGKRADIILFADQENTAVLEAGRAYILALAQGEKLTIADKTNMAAPQQAAAAHVRGVEVFLPLAGLIDIDKEIARLQKEIENTKNEEKRLQGKLSNQAFIAKAPAEVVEKERAKGAEFASKRAALEERLAVFNN